MKKVSLRVAYEVGTKIKHDGGVWQVIGYEYIKGRGTRYILFVVKNGEPQWLYLYDFELKNIF